MLDVTLPLTPLLGAALLWYSAPILVVVSLVCAATRHELMPPILSHAARFGLWIVVFMGLFMGLMALLDWLA
ncbi:MAG: hypothetical protein KF688_19405 [Pirellulales bacterium]|nr:hypothetical protein [Pirellulales bacterium]